MKTEWRCIEGWNYWVSNFGQVRNSKWVLLSPVGTGNGRRYLCVDLCCNGKIKRCLVHRLVASAFLSNPLNLPEVNHIDGNAFNNRVDNLEWVSKSQNQRHRFRVLLQNHLGERNPCSKLTSEDVLQIIECKTAGMATSVVAQKFNVRPTTICDIMHGRSWNHVSGFPAKRHIQRRVELSDRGEVLHL